MLVLLFLLPTRADRQFFGAVADKCLPGGSEWEPMGADVNPAGLTQLASRKRLRVWSDEAMLRRLPDDGETDSAPRGGAPCALAVIQATRPDGTASRAGDVAAVLHQTAAGMRFASDLKLGDMVPLELEALPGTTYSFQTQPGYRDVQLVKLPLFPDKEDELYEALKKPKDET